MKQFVFIIFLLFFIVLKTDAQNRNLIYQHEQELAGATNDNGRVDAMNKLVEDYLATSEEVEDAFWEKPMRYAKEASALAEKINYKRGLANGYANLANVYRKRNNKVQANIYDYKAQKAKSQITDESEKNARAEEQRRIEKESELKRQQEENERQLILAKKQQEENDRLASEGKISKEEAEKRAKEIKSKQEQLAYANLTIVKQKETITSKDDAIKTKDQEIFQTQEEKERLSMLNQIQDQDLKLKDAENENHKKQNTIVLVFAIGGLLLAGLMGLFFYKQRKTTLELSAKNKIIEEERRRSEELLLNILPAELANELKLKGTAQARNYDKVTVLFTDFKDFTKISEKLTPTQLVDEIDYCFRAFDDIVGKFEIEKIKTIGDAYLCAGGIPASESHDPLKVVRAALEIQYLMERIKKEREGTDKPYFEIRIGIHTGPLVAGVVGSKKFAYDIWGDTVNTAARMEQNSEPGRVNISEATFQLVKDSFECTHRGKLYAKNKGEIDMYFVEHEK